jgi:hypothetical protein
MQPVPPDLSERVERAIDAARAQVRRGEVLEAAMSLLADDTLLVTHCAWCHRYALGGHWLEPEERPAFLPPELGNGVTHSICPTCVEKLRGEGLSR